MESSARNISNGKQTTDDESTLDNIEAFAEQKFSETVFIQRLKLGIQIRDFLQNVIHEACCVAQEKEQVEARLEQLNRLDADAHSQGLTQCKEKKLAATILDHSIKVTEGELGDKLSKLKEHEQTVADTLSRLLRYVTDAKEEQQSLVKTITDRAVHDLTTKIGALRCAELEKLQHAIKTFKLATADKRDSKRILDDAILFNHVMQDALEFDKKELNLAKRASMQDMEYRTRALPQNIREKVRGNIGRNTDRLISGALGEKRLAIMSDALLRDQKRKNQDSSLKKVTTVSVQQEVFRQINSVNSQPLTSTVPTVAAVKHTCRRLDEFSRGAVQWVADIEAGTAWKPPKQLLQLEEQIKSSNTSLDDISRFFPPISKRYDEQKEMDVLDGLETRIRRLVANMDHHKYHLEGTEQSTQFDKLHEEVVNVGRKRKRSLVEFDSCQEWIKFLEDRLRETYHECNPETHEMLQLETQRRFNDCLHEIKQVTQ
ncbi:hypothetical protein DFQ28_005318 [Apophysomyces sp. BC1034]|nr:hypothetical protein DFQ28_005318 [Apophysomyces sp. BC1034]